MLKKGRSWTVLALCALLLHLWPLALAKSGAAPLNRPQVNTEALNQSRWSRYEKPRGEANPLKGVPKQLRYDPGALANRARCGQIDFATTKLKGKIYYNNATDHYSYEPDACVLRRLDAQQALSCLAKQGPIVFLGDSVTRYQWLALVHFLAAGKYQHPYDGRGSLTDVWQLDKSPRRYDVLWRTAAREVTAHSGERARLHVVHDRSRGVEHASFMMSDPATKKEARLYFSFVTLATEQQLRNATEWVLAQERRPALTVMAACARYGHASGAQAKDGRRMYEDLRVSLPYLMQRLGLGSSSGSSSSSKRKLLWKTCPSPFRSEVHTWEPIERRLRSLGAKTGFGVYDVRAVVRAALDQRIPEVTTWHDKTVHFMQWVYEEFNDILLNAICPVK